MTRSIVVTGAGSGIGAATARRLSQEGWYVGLLDAAADPVREVAAGLPGPAQVMIADVTDREEMAGALSYFVQQAGHLDAIFNCAGILSVGDFESVDLVNYERLVQVNTLGVINGCHLALPWLRQREQAWVINMSSASAVHGTPGFAVYSASKCFVSGLTEALSIEWARYGIAVADVRAPFVRTPMVENNPAPAMDQMGINLEAEDIAAAVSGLLATPKPPVHRAVSGQLKRLEVARRVLPSGVISRIVAKLTGYADRTDSP